MNFNVGLIWEQMPMQETLGGTMAEIENIYRSDDACRLAELMKKHKALEEEFKKYQSIAQAIEKQRDELVAAKTSHLIKKRALQKAYGEVVAAALLLSIVVSVALHQSIGLVAAIIIASAAMLYAIIQAIAALVDYQP